MFTPPRKHNYSSNFILEDCLNGPNITNSNSCPTAPLVATRVTPPDIRDSFKFCATLEGVLSPEECRSIISRAEEAGFSPALVNIGGGLEVSMEKYRNSDRCIIDDIAFARALFGRIKEAIPGEVMGQNGRTWEVVGLNERMRILKYENGQFFQSHYDSYYSRKNGERSEHTIMVYLNAGGGIDYDGGSTTFLHPENNKKYVEVVPKAGSILVFDHNMLHEGSVLRSGTKYAIRTDLMFKQT
jgi:hypothetical protein